MSKLANAFKFFDEYNSNDPNIIDWDGNEYPAEYFYALQLHKWVMILNPGADEYLQLASRAQHIGRWQRPRTQYPEGKAGYLTWRKDLAKFHSTLAGTFLSQVGYTNDEVDRVQRIILKRDLRVDENVQTMENALCLVFLQFQYNDFLQKNDDNNMIIRILRKTWLKMTEPGRQAALTLSYEGRGKELIEKALAL